jgi:hypothetical protein
MPKGLILEINPGYDVPVNYLERALKNYPNAFGGAIHSKADGKDTLLVSLSDTGITKDELIGALADYKEQRKVLFLGDFPKGYNGADIQPFVVLEEPVGTTQMVAFMEGDFSPANPEEKTDHSNEYYAFDDILRPTLFDLFESDAVGCDIDKMLNTIDHDSKITRTLNLLCSKRGTLTLLAVNGAIRKPVAKNELARTYPWGTVSNHLDYEEKVEAKPSEKKGFLSRTFGSKTKEPDAPVDNATKAEPETVIPKTETVIPAGAGKGPVTAILHERENNLRLSDKIIAAPPKMSGRPLKNWLHNHVGYVPQNWNQHGNDGFVLTCRIAEKKVNGVKDAPIKSFADPKLQNALGSEKEQPKKADSPPLTAAERRKRALAAQKAQGGEGEKPAVVEPQPKPTPKEVEPDNRIIPKKELEGLESWQKQFTGCDGAVIVIDPEIMTAMTEEVPDYAEQTGRQGLELVFHMSLEQIHEHIKKYPIASGVLMKNLINAWGDSIQSKAAAPVVEQKPAKRVNFR